MKKYFTGNVLYLPILPDGLGLATTYVKASVSGDIFLNQLCTRESLEKRFAAGELKEFDMTMPTTVTGCCTYTRVW